MAERGAWQQGSLDIDNCFSLPSSWVAAEVPAGEKVVSEQVLTMEYARSHFSRVPFPLELDMRKTGDVVQLLREFIAEEADLNEGYLGAVIFGSVSMGTASNASDIDLVHVISTASSYDAASRVRESVGSMFRHLYEIDVHQSSHTSGSFVITREQVAGMTEFPTSPHEYSLPPIMLLDQYSIPLFTDLAVYPEINRWVRPEKSEALRKISEKERSYDEAPHALHVDQLLDWSPWISKRRRVIEIASDDG